MDILLALYGINNQEIWLKICILLMTTNVYITAYVVRLRAIACKECLAPTSFSQHYDSMDYHTSTAKKKKQNCSIKGEKFNPCSPRKI
jgi:hypothetical protein